MESIKGFVITLVSIIIIISAIELIAPDNSMKKYLKFVLGSILIAIMLNPIISIFSTDKEEISNEIQEYLDLIDNKKKNNINTPSNGSEEIFIKSLEENCNTLLNEEFTEFEFFSSIDCDINMQSYEYTINKIEIEVKEKGVEKVEEIIINNDRSNIEKERVESQDKIIKFLANTLKIQEDKIVIYKK